MKRDETFVHIAIRDLLKAKGWTLVAGQYPGGSDDELYTFNVFDPTLARDGSPDHRRHSFGKLVPDLIAYKNGTLLTVEAKPEYSSSDREKLEYLLTERREDFFAALEKFAKERGFMQILPLKKINVIPVLAFLSEYVAPDNGRAHLVVKSLDDVVPQNLKL